MRVYRATIEYSHRAPSAETTKCGPSEFDTEDLEVIAKHIRVALATCPQHELYALRRLADLLDNA